MRTLQPVPDYYVAPVGDVPGLVSCLCDYKGEVLRVVQGGEIVIVVRRDRALVMLAARAEEVDMGAPRMFVLDRQVDATGVSGTGIVAEGVEFSNGKCAVSWLTDVTSVAVYDGIEQVRSIHGHDGQTEIVYADEARVRIPTALEAATP